MRSFQDLPIRRKLTWLVLLAGGAPILLSSVALLANNVYLLRLSKVEEMSALTSVLGDNSAAALAFDDPAAARDVLKSLVHQPDIRFACVYHSDGKPFASFAASESEGWQPPPATKAMVDAVLEMDPQFGVLLDQRLEKSPTSLRRRRDRE